MALQFPQPSLLTASTVASVQKILQPLTAVAQVASRVSLLASGIPALLHPPAGATQIAVLTADAPIYAGSTAGVAVGPAGSSSAAQWGIFLNHVLVLSADSVASFDYKKDWRVAQYPQEAGAFQSYNKVQAPFDVRLRLTKGGTEADRADFFAALDKVQASLDLYDIVTPERTYSSATIVHVDYRRTSGAGLGLITADVWLSEIRVSASSAFSNVVSPSGANAADGGTVQAQPTTAAQDLSLHQSLTSGSW